MVALNHESTAFVYLLDNYMMRVEGVNVLRDSSESRRKVFSGCINLPYDYNIFLVPAKNLVLVSWDYLGGDGKFLIDIPSRPLVVGYSKGLIDALEVTK